MEESNSAAKLFFPSTSEAHENPRKRQRIRKMKKEKHLVLDDGGCIVEVELDFKQSSWYMLYVVAPHTWNRKFMDKFRRLFRMPYESYLELVEICKTKRDEDGVLYFRRWTSKDAVGVESSPLELMLLGALRYLGRGWTFDDVEEATGISEETHRQFFEAFINFGSTVLYQKWVVPPTHAADAAAHAVEYGMAGFSGCVASCDATHIMLERCNYAMRQAHLGFKMSHTARTYNLTVNHRRMILATTQGFPARWNDKTVILFDDFVRGIHDGKYLQDCEFDLYEFDSNGNVATATYCGAWVIVDNGYLNWSATQPPIKKTLDRREIRWSQWLESIRKDVECTFGILKGRWRILKAGVRVHGVQKADQIWFTCCALHNWLLDVDGLNHNFDEGVPSLYEGDFGELARPEDVEQYGLPMPVQRLLRPAQQRGYHDQSTSPYCQGYDLSSMGLGSDVTNSSNAVDIEGEEGPGASNVLPAAGTTAVLDVECEEEPASDLLPAAAGSVLAATTTPTRRRRRAVRELSMTSFRKKLIEHFDIMWRRNELVWPRRSRQRPASYL